MLNKQTIVRSITTFAMGAALSGGIGYHFVNEEKSEKLEAYSQINELEETITEKEELLFMMNEQKKAMQTELETTSQALTDVQAKNEKLSNDFNQSQKKIKSLTAELERAKTVKK